MLRLRRFGKLSDKKRAVFGIEGEIEHAAAILHPRFGKPVREAIEKGDDIIPSTKKMGGPGSSITLPITNKKIIWSFDHMDASETTRRGPNHGVDSAPLSTRRRVQRIEKKPPPSNTVNTTT